MGTFKFPVKRDKDGNLTHKTCRGPRHLPGKLLPLDNFYKCKRAYRAWCRECESFYQSQIRRQNGNRKEGSKNPWRQQIEYEKVRFIFEELVRRLGIYEMLRRVEIDQNTYWRLRHHRQKRLGRPYVERAMNVLKECRINNEVRHKDSIARGATMRGEDEREITRNIDYYRPTGDEDVEKRKAYRRKYENKGRAA